MKRVQQHDKIERVPNTNITLYQFIGRYLFICLFTIFQCVLLFDHYLHCFIFFMSQTERKNVNERERERDGGGLSTLPPTSTRWTAPL